MALLPREAHPQVSQALLELFRLPEAQALFASALPEQRADCLARFLCGLRLPWDGHATLSPPTARGRVSVLATGCFDLMHPGHYNALRQAKAIFRREGYEQVRLVAGVHSDAAIAAAKGPPVIPHSERLEMVRACKWVDEVAENLRYAVPLRLLDELRCDFAVHGDDMPTVSGGGGLFDEIVSAGRMRIVKRTEGMSTTDLISRLMSASGELEAEASSLESSTKSVLLPTISRLAEFHEQSPTGACVRRGHAPSGLANHRVVYVPGIWDLFHVGHVRFLQLAAQHGDFVLVGALGDDDVKRRLGQKYPLQSLHERALALLSCRYVDDVLLGAPWRVTQDLITTMNVSVVCAGCTDFCGIDTDSQEDAFEFPQKLGILQRLDTGCEVTLHFIAQRILQHSEEFAIRQKRKESEERTYLAGKAFVAEA